MSATATGYRRPRLSAKGDMYPYERYVPRPPASRSTTQPRRPPTPYASLSQVSDSSTSSSRKLYTPPSSLDSRPILPRELRNTASSIDDMCRASATPISCSDTKGACELKGSVHGLDTEVTTPEQLDFIMKYSKLTPEQYHAFHDISKDSDLRRRSQWSQIMKAAGVHPSIVEHLKYALHDFDRQYRPEPLELEDNPGGDSTYAGSEADTLGRTDLVRVHDNQASAYEGYHADDDDDDEDNERYREPSYSTRTSRMNSPAHRYPETSGEGPDIEESDFEYIYPRERRYRI